MSKKVIVVIFCLGLLTFVSANDNSKCEELFTIKKYNEAINYCKKAIDQGDFKAQYFLGMMYFKGLGVSQNYQKAFKLYEKAATRGEYLAQFFLGNMYSEGQRGITRLQKSSFMV